MIQLIALAWGLMALVFLLLGINVGAILFGLIGLVFLYIGTVEE